MVFETHTSGSESFSSRKDVCRGFHSIPFLVFFVFGLWTQGSVAQQALEPIFEISAQRALAARKSQVKIDQLADEQTALKSDYKHQQNYLDGLRRYNNLLEKQIMDVGDLQDQGGSIRWASKEYSEREEYVPIVKVSPIYPERARSLGISGYCVVKYTLTTTGAVSDPVAVDCLPKGIFEQASVKAIAKFKYRPRMEAGMPLEVSGLINKFTFDLSVDPTSEGPVYTP